MRTKAEDIAGRLEYLIKKILETKHSGLIYDRPYVKVSDVATQYFCEQKVDLLYKLGEIETDSKRRGEEAHAELLKDSIKVERKYILSKIESGELVVVREMFLVTQFKEVLIAGQPDLVVFYDSAPKLLLEHKYPTRDLRPWPNYHVQARIYSWLLKEVGFDAQDLLYALVLAEQSSKESHELRKIWHNILQREPKPTDVLDIITNPPYVGRVKVFVEAPDYNKAEEELSWALDFWKGFRKAKPTKKLNKCLSCGYLKECPYISKTSTVS